VGCLVYHAASRIAQLSETTTDIETLGERQAKACDLICQAYEAKTQKLGYPEFKIDREHLRVCCDMRRDFIKHVYKDLYCRSNDA